MVDKIIDALPTIASHIAFVAVVFFAIRLICNALKRIIDARTHSETGRSVSLLTNILNLIIYAIGILIVLSHFNISIAPILTAMGVGGMAVALGLQETLQNIFSGLWLIVSKQIQTGDFVRLSDGQQGRVMDITWRYTTVQSVLGNLIVIPNKNLASSVITNYNLPQKDITIKIPIGVAYNSDLDKVEQVTLEVANKVMHDMAEYSEIPPKVLFHTFGDSAIEFDVLIHSARFEMQVELKHNFIKALTRRYREEGINIPYPIQTVIHEGK
ncbi:MAG: mechanosensitive ion channel family protein [Selenomonadaceae bacterium]|nr:mechanosensitive ion channel family protein [Selenomonadaceae bacterium]